MKSMLGKVVLTAVGALAVAGVSAPAYAHVGVAGGGQFIASADPVFVAGEQWGVAHTSHILTGGEQWGWATSTAVGGGQDGFAHIG
ncbi:hypothetical protein [Kitasatospora sp. NPDC057223]|jgi:hypothetical protein|uniref:hypothetical protein n=1 Tax=Kitasatospora sp. NPDC057223 TaxID=3346055 RepID=UPI00363ACE10